MRYTIDCEFDGHGGRLLSMCLIPEFPAKVFYYVVDQAPVSDPWVAENVVPHMLSVPDGINIIFGTELELGDALRAYIGDEDTPTILADSCIDIGRFCHAIHTDSDGKYTSWGGEEAIFHVVNVDCWPNELGEEAAVQHNAYWDAEALWEKLYVLGI